MSLSSIQSEIWNRFCDYLDPTQKRKNPTPAALFSGDVAIKHKFRPTISAGKNMVLFGYGNNDGEGANIRNVIEIIGRFLERAYKESEDHVAFQRQTATYSKSQIEHNVPADTDLVCGVWIQRDIWILTQQIFIKFLNCCYHVDCDVRKISVQDGKNLPGYTNFKYHNFRWTLSWNPIWNLKAIPDYPLPLFKEQSISLNDPLGVKFWEAFNEKHTDVAITCGDNKIVKAHQSMLCRSTVLKAMLTHRMSERDTKCTSFSEPSNVVTAVIKYLYLKVSPFGNQVDESLTGLCFQILPLAHRLQIQPLVDNCATYIAQHTDPKEWEDIGKIGAQYANRILLETYDAHRIRKGERLPIAFKDAFKMCGFPVPAPSCRIHIRCDVGNRNTFGIRIAPTFEHSSRYEWDPSINGWSGYAPIGKEFKFVKILRDGQIEWEKIDGNRLISEESDEILKLDVQF